jgi:hypothetical protein
MDIEAIFFTLFTLWYFSIYGPPYSLFIFFRNVFQKTGDLLNFVKHFNDMMTSKIFIDSDNDNESDSDTETLKTVIKYEDKYLKEFRKMDKELKFDETEQKIKDQKYIDFLNEMKETYTTKITELKTIVETNNAKIDKYTRIGPDNCIYDDNDEECLTYSVETKEQKIKTLNDENTKLCEEINELRKQIDTKEGQEEIFRSVEEKTNKFMIEQRLERLKNCYVMEHTPLGNVLMMYDKERESFKFYSDNSIPYRYLEVVGRKCAKHFGIKQIFIDMEEELKFAEEIWEKERKEKVEQAEQERIKKEESIKNNKPFEQKKSVFAKFKNYNKESGSGHVNIGAPPKNSIPNKKITEKSDSEKILLKEKANRYTYEGKFANFSFLKKIDRKDINKKYAMTFADFKKMQQAENTL